MDGCLLKTPLEWALLSAGDTLPLGRLLLPVLLSSVKNSSSSSRWEESVRPCGRAGGTELSAALATTEGTEEAELLTRPVRSANTSGAVAALRVGTKGSRAATPITVTGTVRSISPSPPTAALPVAAAPVAAAAAPGTALHDPSLEVEPRESVEYALPSRTLSAASTDAPSPPAPPPGRSSSSRMSSMSAMVWYIDALS